MAINSLKKITVLDVSEHVAGAYCTKLLGGFGARVIKVEKPKEGDILRRMGPFPENKPHSEKSALFLYLNTCKEGITLNLKSNEGAKIFKRLVAKADIVVENFKPGEMAHLGLGFKTLKAIHPGLIMASITPFGQTGPYKDYNATSITSYAMGGQMYVSGETDREPLFCGSFQPEYVAGLNAFVGIMTALHDRRQTGQGQQLDISIMECMNSSHQFTLTWPAYSGTILKRPGWPGSIRPIHVYRCKNGYIVLRIADIAIEFFAALFHTPELAEDPRFQTEEDRLAHLVELDAIVKKETATLDKKQIFRMAGEWQMLSGFVSTPEDLFNDPHYRERDFWVDIDHPAAGKLTYPGAPVKMGKTPWQTKRAPLLGENNDAFYMAELGFTRVELEQLSQSGVI